MVFTGKVISLYDEYGARRIKVRLKDPDANLSDNDLPYAWPLLPKMLQVLPKQNETVIVLCENDDPKKQRYYIGPIISQYQRMFYDRNDTGALKMLNGQGGKPFPSFENVPKMNGAFGEDDDVILYGRKNSDIILSDTDLRIRCGAHLVDRGDNTDIGFNLTNPAVIKLKYHEFPVDVTKKLWNNDAGDMTDTENKQVESSINIIGQEINLISTNGSPYVNTSNTDNPQNGDESLSDTDLKNFIESAHPMPYGDVLLRFLHIFKEAFFNHTHKYHQLKPVPDMTYLKLKKFNMQEILSKNVRLN